MSKRKSNSFTKADALRSIAENVNYIRWRYDLNKDHALDVAKCAHDALNVAGWLVVLQVITVVTLFIIIACVSG